MEENLIFKKPTKRKASERFSGSFKVPLPKRVSDWKRSHLHLLNIYYAEDFLDEPLNLLSKIPSLVELNKAQKEYIREANRFLQFEASVEKLQLHNEVVSSAISELYTTVESQPEKLVTVKVRRFIMAFDRLLHEVQYAFRTFKTYDGLFSQFVGSFAELCCLEAINCCIGHKTTWHDLAHCTVVSEPEFRLYKSGLEQRRTDSIITVVEVKNDIKIKTGKKRYKSSSEYSSDDNYSSSCSSVASSSYSMSSLTGDNQDTNVPLLERIINKRVLGQHGGELLMDMNRYMYQGATAESVLNMPGIIVDQTKVIFTLLVMSKTHLDKIRNNNTLDSSDRAVIYYSKPLDILSEESRVVLIENFMRLNNI